jgi:hypothetical protein
LNAIGSTKSWLVGIEQCNNVAVLTILTIQNLSFNPSIGLSAHGKYNASKSKEIPKLPKINKSLSINDSCVFDNMICGVF